MSSAFSRIREVLLYSTVVLDDKGNIRKQIDEDNRRVGVVWAAVEIAFWVFCLIVSTYDPEFERCRELYIVTLALTAITFVLMAFVAPKYPKITRPTVIAMQLILLGAGIGLIYFQWDVRSSTFIAAVLIVPVMFLTDTLPTLVCIVLGVALVMVMGPLYIEPEVYSWTRKTLFIFAIAGILIGHVINKARFERYKFAEAAMELAELRHKFAYVDQLTGLQNRRAYSERIDQLEKDMPASCCVISADINGLKRTNDTYGHNAGDELLVGAAECLRTSFEGVGEVYRLGGDEFCVIATITQEDAARRLLQMEQMSASWKGRYIDGVSISYGMAPVQENQSIDSALETADRKMYEFKRNYYTESGRDRRHRLD